MESGESEAFEGLSTPPRWRWPYNGRGGYKWSSRTAVGCSQASKGEVSVNERCGIEERRRGDPAGF